MTSVSSSTAPAANREFASSPSLKWQSWPLVENRRWSWAVPLAMLAFAAAAMYVSGSWLVGLVTLVALAAAMWQFLLPTTFEIHRLGFCSQVFGRTRLVPWHAVRSYQPRSTGVVLYRCVDPTAIDALRSLFIPYPSDEDELLCVIRDYLGHAVELPAQLP